jgi:class 3 adenylate cyclase
MTSPMTSPTTARAAGPAPAAARPRRRSFHLRLLVMAALLVTVPLVAVGWRLVDVNRAALEDATREQLFAVVGDVAHTLDGSLDGAERELTAIGRILVRADLAEDARMDLVRAQLEASTTLRAIAIFDEAGAPVGSLSAATAAGDPVEPLPASLPAEARAASPATGVTLGAVVRGPDGPRVTMIAPLAGTRATWYAVALVSLAAVQDRVERLAEQSFAGDADSLVVVDRELRIVAHPDPERALTLPPAPRDGVLAAPPPVGHDDGVLVFAVHRTARGKQVTAARQLGRTGWLVVAQLPHDRAFASVGRMRRSVAIAIVAALLLALLATAAWSARLAAPVRRLVAFAGDLAARRFDRRVSLRTGDELEALASAMSGAAAELETSEAKLAEERRIRADLGRYLPVQLVEQVVRHEQDLALGGERRTVTVMFADVAAFTTLVERLPPEQVVTILNQLFTILTEIVFRHGGTVDKLIGDCVMAFWGAPTRSPDHAARAVAAAGDMMRWLEVGNDAWQATHGVTIHLAIGINTGEVVVGNFGSETRMEYTCIGEPVNVAARLEALARPQQILVTAATRDAAPAAEYLPVGNHALPGRQQPIELFEVRP